jgi:hypothetical protein
MSGRVCSIVVHGASKIAVIGWAAALDWSDVGAFDDKAFSARTILRTCGPAF